jgi:hypothetical protein
MLIVFNEIQAELIGQFSKLNLSQDVLSLFAELIKTQLISTPSKDVLTQFGKQNNIDQASLLAYIRAYSYLFIESVKYKISDADFKQSLTAVEKNTAFVKELTKVDDFFLFCVFEMFY